MAKYTADIEIAVRGGQQIDGVIKGLNRLNNSINVVNRNAKLLEGKNFNVASMENYARAVSKAERALRKAAEGTAQEASAVSALVTAINIENKARERRNFLIAQEVANRRRVIATANAGFGVQGPQAAQIRAGRGPASPLRGTVNMPGSPAALAAGAARGSRTTGGRGIQGRLGEALGGGIIGAGFPLLFGQTGGAAVGGAVGGVLGGLAGPGGSFAGSILGTVIGEIASKGQAITELSKDLGFSAQQADLLAAAFRTANTDVEKFTATIQNIKGVGLELEDQVDSIQLVTALTEKYGGTWEKIGNAITSSLESGKVTQATLNQLTSQGITIQDTLATKYGVSRDAVLQMAKDGEISVQSLLDTLVDLGNASVASAEKVKTPFEQAIGTTISLFQSFWKEVQTIFAGVGGQGTNAATKLINVFNTLLKEVLFPIGRVLAKIAALFVDVVSTGVSAATDLIVGFRGVASAIAESVSNIINMIPGLRTVVGLARGLVNAVIKPKSSDWNDMAWPEGVPKPGSPGMIGRIAAPSQFEAGGGGARGSKPPEDRTKSLLADLQATIAIGDAEDRIRDLLFQGRDVAAARAELEKTIYDIDRDRIKQLEQAKYLSEKEAINKIAAARTANAVAATEDKIREIQQQRFEDDLRAQEAVRNAVKPFTDLTKQQELQAQYSKTYLRLVTEGMLPAEAERIANFEQLVSQQTSAVAEQITLTEAAILEAKAREVSSVELEKQLKALKARQTAIGEAATQGPGRGPTREQRAADAIAQIRGELNQLADPINAAVTGANAIGSAFSQAFQGIATGTMTAQEALSNFFKSIGEAFVSMAAEIIAKQLVMITLQTILKALGAVPGGGGGGGGGSGGGISDIGNWQQYAFDGPGVPFTPPAAFAEGGFVTGPTRALIGEGGEPEYVIPQSKMSAAMSRYSRGARGESVIPGNGTSTEGGGAATATMEPIDVRYSVERINNVDYVTADQFQRGMAQAARQGAIQGERRAMRSLKNSAATRRGVGI